MSWFGIVSAVLLAGLVTVLGVMLFKKVYGGSPAFQVILAAVAVLLPPFTCILTGGWGLSLNVENWLALINGLTGWTCLAFYPSGNSLGKWALFTFYPLIVWLMLGVFEVFRFGII